MERFIRTSRITLHSAHTTNYRETRRSRVEESEHQKQQSAMCNKETICT